VEQTEYDVLKKTLKQFTPYKDLWLTADEWTKKYHFVMTDSLLNLDAPGLEVHVQSSWKTIHKCLKVCGRFRSARFDPAWLRGCLVRFRSFGCRVAMEANTPSNIIPTTSRLHVSRPLKRCRAAGQCPKKCGTGFRSLCLTRR
jgi:hypothetical protein